MEYHLECDSFVKEITVGLTMHRVAKGEWINPSGELYKDKMIPVHVSCTEEEIYKIIDFTIKHYDQEAVTAYAISDYVIIKHKNEI